MFVVTAEVRGVPGEQQRRRDPNQGGEEASRRDPAPLEPIATRAEMIDHSDHQARDHEKDRPASNVHDLADARQSEEGQELRNYRDGQQSDYDKTQDAQRKYQRDGVQSDEAALHFRGRGPRTSL
jgi:hypothetical protein